MSKNEPLPCPHCGAEPTMYDIEAHQHTITIGGFKMPDHPGSAVIECGCGAGMIDDTKEAVLARWNQRTVTHNAGVTGQPPHGTK